METNKYESHVPVVISAPILVKDEHRELLYDLCRQNKVKTEILRFYKHDKSAHYMMTGLDENVIDAAVELGEAVILKQLRPE